MSAIGQALNNWLQRRGASVMRQEATVCDAIPPNTQEQMIAISVDSASKIREMGAAITHDYTLGRVFTGTQHKVLLPRPEGTIGTYHCLPAQEYVYIPGLGPQRAWEAPYDNRHWADGLYEIETKRGGKITITGNHPFLVLTDNPPIYQPEYWKLAQDLLPDDILQIETHLPVPIDDGIYIPEFNLRNYWQIHHYPHYPDKLTPDIGELLGLTWSDGEVRVANHASRVSFTNTDTQLLHQVYEMIGDIFHLKPDITQIPIDHSEAYIVHIDSKLLALYFQQALGFTKYGIPKILWRASQPIREAFRVGTMKGDGSECQIKPKLHDFRSQIAVGEKGEAAVGMAYLLATLGYRPNIRLLRQNLYPHNFDYTYLVNYQSGIVRHHNKMARVKSVKRIDGKVIVYDFHTDNGILYIGNLPYISHNTHPFGAPFPSIADTLEAMNRNDRLMCIGASGKPGTKIQCFTPNKPKWDDFQFKLRLLIDDVKDYNKKVMAKHKGTRAEIRLKVARTEPTWYGEGIALQKRRGELEEAIRAEVRSLAAPIEWKSPKWVNGFKDVPFFEAHPNMFNKCRIIWEELEEELPYEL